MDDQPASSTLRRFRSIFEGGAVAGLTDGQLLERFATGRGPAADVAFEALLIRHGPMVLGVCRRALPDPNDADDAFQATFLVLVRKARSVRVDDSLGRWLYGVSRKVASRARSQASKRRTTGLAEAEHLASPTVDSHARDLAEVLDDELSRLPEPYRSAVTLCDLAGLTLEEAARDLRCPVGTIKSRLARGRDRLRARLIRRGVAPAAILIGRGSNASAALIGATARAASTYVATGVMSAGVVPATALVLAEGVIRAMTWNTGKSVAAIALSIGVGLNGVGVLAQSQGEGKPAEPSAKVAASRPEVSQLTSALDRRVTVHFKDKPLNQAIGELMKLSGINIMIDPVALTREGLTPETKIDIQAEEVKLRSVLKMMLRPLGLEPREETDVVLITNISASAGFDSLGRLDIERLKAEGRLEKARAEAKTPDDPKLIRASREFDEIEATVDQVKAFLARAVNRPEAVAERLRSLPKEGQKVVMPEYIVEAPDVIEVNVLEALNDRPIMGEHLVMPDGRISLGFYGRVFVAGLTVAQIKEKIILHLRQHLGDEALGLKRTTDDGKVVEIEPSGSAKVCVEVVSYNSKVYYVQGEVATPGRLPITGNETVLDAINYAGGLTTDAERLAIRLVRPARSGTIEETLPVDFKGIVERGDTKTNYQLFPGDRLIAYRVVPVANQEARMREMERKLELILQKLDTLGPPATEPAAPKAGEPK